MLFATYFQNIFFFQEVGVLAKINMYLSFFFTFYVISNMSGKLFVVGVFLSKIKNLISCLFKGTKAK